MNDQEFQDPPSPEEEDPNRRRRTALITMLIILVVALGYAAVLFVAGSALQEAPFARQILRVREELRSLTSLEPPRSLQPVLQPPAGINVTPSPVEARPSPSVSPSFIAPSPDSPTVVTFTIFYENTTGVRLTGVKVTSRVPAGTALVRNSATPAASTDGSRVVWQLGTLDPGENGELVFKVLTRRTGTIVLESVMESNEAPDAPAKSSARVR